MNGDTFNRLHTLRMSNDAARYRQEELKPRFDRLAGRHENGTAPRAISAYQLFQTPIALAFRLAAGLQIQLGQTGLEPSCGLGRLVDAAMVYEPAHVVGVEVAPDCARELFYSNRPHFSLVQQDFLSLDPKDFKPFDFVIMNPPFHMRSDIRHIQHALKFLRPGGRLGAILMNTAHRVRALKDSSDSWEELPAGAFKETGTYVSTVLAYFTVS